MSKILLGAFLSIFTILMLVALTVDLWALPVWRFKRWLARRNQRLCDFKDKDPALVGMIHGLIDCDFYWKVYHKAQDYEEPDKLTVTGKLSKKLQSRIERRYNTRGMKNAYKRALETLKDYKKLAIYHQADSEFVEMCEKALEVRNHLCLRCDGAGGYWVDHGCGSQSYAKCSCPAGKDSLF